MKQLSIGSLFYLFLFPTLLIAQLMPTDSPTLGETFGQKRVFLAARFIPYSIHACRLDAKTCALTAEENLVLQKIVENLSGVGQKLWIEFVSEKQRPDLFRAGHGPHRLAVTGNKPGDTLYFNSDLLEDPDLQLSTLVSVLFHELGHHAGYKDSAEGFLDQFGNKMAQIFSRGLTVVPAGPLGQSHLRILTHQVIPSKNDFLRLGSPDVALIPAVVAMDGKTILDLTNSFANTVDCFYGATMNKLWPSSLRWTGTLEIPALGERQIVAEVNESHFCEASGGIKVLYHALFRITLGLKADSEGILRFSGTSGVSNPLSDWVETDLSPLITPLLGSYLPEPTRLKVTATKLSATALSAGDILKTEFEFNTASEFPLEACYLVLASEELTSRYSSGQTYAFETKEKDCRMEKLSPNSYRAVATYKIPASTPSRNYEIRAFAAQLSGKNNTLPIPVYGQSQKRLSFKVTGNGDQGLRRPLKFKLKTSQGQEASLESPAFLKQYWCQNFHLSIEAEGSAPLLQSHLWYQIHYKNAVRRPVVIMERLSNNNLYGWKIEHQVQGSRSFFDHTFSIQQEFLAPEDFDRVEFLRFSLMTKDLRETVVDFPSNQFGVRIIFPSPSCN
jgi:hypothetical protein